MKALLIDDSQIVRKVIQGVLLSTCGFTEVVQKEDGELGLSEIKENPSRYDIIFLDWKMPKMDGIEVLVALRKLGCLTPVVICTAVGDKQSIVSAIGKGANDYLVKPFKSIDLEMKSQKIISNHKLLLSHQADSKRALIIDDSHIVREVIKKILLNDKVVSDVVCVEDGAIGLKRFLAEKFDVIILDWQMPKMDGIEVLKAIRKVNTEIPIVMATGNSEPDQIVEAFDAGATNFISKPFKPEEILQKVHRVLLS